MWMRPPHPFDLLAYLRGKVTHPPGARVVVPVLHVSTIPLPPTPVPHTHRRYPKRFRNLLVGLTRLMQYVKPLSILLIGHSSHRRDPPAPYILPLFQVLGDALLKVLPYEF
jgi:hypothetical protein